MSKIVWRLALLALLIGGSTGLSKDPKLTWKALDKKTPFLVEVSTKTEQAITVSGATNRTGQTFGYSYLYLPLRKQDDDYVVAAKILSLRWSVPTGGKNLKGQWKSPAAKAPQIILAINPKTMTVKKADGIKAAERMIIKQLGLKIDKTTIAFIKANAFLYHGAVFHLGRPSGGMFETGRWQTDDKMELPGLGKYRFQKRFTYTGKKGDLQRIKLNGSINFIPAKDNELPFTISKADMTGSKIIGDIWFNSKKGRPERASWTHHVIGTLEIEIARTKTTVKLDQKQHFELRVKDVK